ncbi:MAG TPA: SsrA-binding protein SmpB [Nitrospiria bacterium]|nr:SsrA-binding protein SmpB [Nitrospiria bacterium]
MTKKETTASISNKKAYHDFFVDETYEAGICLTGTEVKSVRLGQANLKESFARVENNEVFLYQCHINPYAHGNRANPDPVRVRKLLLHKKEIARLTGLTQQKGHTLIPLKMYFKNGRAKVELGVARGKKNYDKREDIKSREAKRELEKVFKDRHK